MKGISGKNAIVAAGGSGLGLGIAAVMAGYGANVTIFSRKPERLESAAADIRKRTGRDVNAVAADLSRKEDLERVVGSARSRHGKIDFLIMNYGDPKVAPFLEITDTEWDYSIDMMLRSTLALTRLALADMVERGAGRIVYVTSMTTKSPMENFAISASLRSAIVALGKVLSMELGPQGINVNSISQGFFMTERLKNVARHSGERSGLGYEKALEAIRQSIPMKRFGDPEELGQLVAFLCADESSYLTGTNIQIDGGTIKFPF